MRRALNPLTQAVLDAVRAASGCTSAEVHSAVGHSSLPRVRDLLYSLSDRGYVYSERQSAVLERLWFAPTDGASRPRPVAPPGALAAPRQVPVDTPWPEPYLRGAPMRAGSQDYRACPSVRCGGHRVHCYRETPA